MKRENRPRVSQGDIASQHVWTKNQDLLLFSYNDSSYKE